VATQLQEDAEGEETAREAVGSRGTHLLAPGGVRVIRLWRGAKGYERIARET